MTFPALDLQKGFDTLLSQHGDKGLDARRTFEFIALDPVDFLHRINGGTRIARQQFKCRFSRHG